jgi:membrane protease YdiL (CAAX protease family)
MKSILSIFWNDEQGRLRAGWRLGLTGLLATLLVGLAQVPLLALQNAGGRSSLFLVANILSVTLTILVCMAVAGRFFDHRRFADFGLHFSGRWWADFGFGLALGAGLMALIFLFELAAGWVIVTGYLDGGNQPFWNLIWLPALVYICVGVQEEMASRGYLLRNLAEGWNIKRIGPRAALIAAYVVSSLIFGGLHAANPNASLVSTLNIACAGLFLGLGFVLTGELAIPIGLHISWNFFQGNVFGFPVSGTRAGPSFIAIQQAGPTWATGGAFGPEAGVIGLAAIALGCGLTLWWVRQRTGRMRLQEELAEYQEITDPPDLLAPAGAARVS